MTSPSFRTLSFTIAALLGASVAEAQTVTLTATNPTPTAGGAAYGLTIVATAGAGPLTVTTPLPAHAVFHNVSVAGAAIACSGPAVGENGTVTCSNPAYAGGNSTISIVAQIIADVTSGIRTTTATLVSGATMVSDPEVQNIQNNSALNFSKTATALAEKGDNIVYNLRVQNTGSSSAINVVVTDVLPTEVTFVSAIGTGAFHDACSFNPDTDSLVCNATFVRAGFEDITLVVKMRDKLDKAPPKTMYTISNTASITAAVGVVNQPTATATTGVVK